MNGRTGILIALAAAAAIPLVWKLLAQRQAADRTVATIIEETLVQHKGEESPIVHAFEEALEQEQRHEAQLAQDVGVRA